MNEVTVANDIDTGVATSDSTVVVLLDSDTEVIQTFEQGPPGPQGAPGVQGQPGQKGDDGNTVLYGPANPVEEGVDGDFYINTTSHFIFGPKTAGAWPAGTSLIGPQGIQGIQGVPGADGNTVLYGAADPVAGTGVNGNFYINTTTHFLFGPKAAGAWPAGTSMVGPQGPQGVPGTSISPATAVPLIDGVGAVGASVKYAREDHVHPSDVAASAVRFDVAQSLSTPAQLQARQNIYAAPLDAMSYSGIQINGSCEVNQRIGSVNTALALVNGSPPKYAVDGIRAAFKHAAATAAFTVNQGGSAPVGIPNSATLVGGAALSAPAAGDFAFISVPVEGYRCARLGWNTGVQMPLTAVFLFYASAAGTFAVSVRSGISDRSYVTEVAYPVANTWQFCKVTIPPPPSGGTWQIGTALGLDFAVAMCVGSTFQAANNSWSNGNFFGTPGTTNFFATGSVFAAISGVTLLPGNDGPMTMAQLGNIQRPFAEELARCQRYYEKSFDYNVFPAAGTGVNATCVFPQAGGAATAPIQPQVFFKTTKRVTPTVTLFNPQNPGAMIRNVTRASDFPATALNAVSPDAFQVFATTPGSSQAWDTCALHWTAEAGF